MGDIGRDQFVIALSLDRKAIEWKTRIGAGLDRGSVCRRARHTHRGRRHGLRPRHRGRPCGPRGRHRESALEEEPAWRLFRPHDVGMEVVRVAPRGRRSCGGDAGRPRVAPRLPRQGDGQGDLADEGRGNGSEGPGWGRLFVDRDLERRGGEAVRPDDGPRRGRGAGVRREVPVDLQPGRERRPRTFRPPSSAATSSSPRPGTRPAAAF
jgi:hypothetical protein